MRTPFGDPSERTPITAPKTPTSKPTTYPKRSSPSRSSPISNRRQTPASSSKAPISTALPSPPSNSPPSTKATPTSDPTRCTRASKLAQILLVRGLVRRMVDNEPGFQGARYDGPWVNSTHPSAVATDELGQAVDAHGTMVKGLDRS